MIADVYRPKFTRGDLARMFARRGYTTGAEIGTRQGAYAWNLCLNIPGLQLLCVDPYGNYPGTPRNLIRDHAENERIARERLAPFDVYFAKGLSMDVVTRVALFSLDFVYIDGNHDYEYVRDDLAGWSMAVKRGGVIAGDDFDAPGVRRALMEFAESRRIDRIWLCDDRGRRTKNGAPMTSWWFDKP